MAENETERVGALLPVAIMNKVRRAQAQMSKSSGGARITVTHALTFLLRLGLTDFERMKPPAPGEGEGVGVPRPMTKGRAR